jgi:hypothetical protein
MIGIPFLFAFAIFVLLSSRIASFCSFQASCIYLEFKSYYNSALPFLECETKTV